MSNLYEKMPKLLFGEDLKHALTSTPDLTPECAMLSSGERLLRLMDIYKVFVPQEMACEIYQKLYLMTLMSLQQKGTKSSVRQLNQIYRWAQGSEYHGVITGASSCTVIGPSGIGKSTCIEKAVELLGPVIENNKPYMKVIPVVVVTCPFDSNYKGLLCQILISIDEQLGTDYYEKSQKMHLNAQLLLSQVCKLCHLHVGILIIDEIQFLTQHKAGTQLYRMILQLINTSGISIILVGTNECLDYFAQAPQMARRTAGLIYKNLSYDTDFREITGILFRYQYVKKKAELTESMLSWLYEHTAGNPANLMAILHDAQEIAIVKGTEKLDIASLTEAYSKRMQMLHGFIEQDRKRLPKTSKKIEKGMDVTDVTAVTPVTALPQTIGIAEIAAKIKLAGDDVISVFRQHFEVEEVIL